MKKKKENMNEKKAGISKNKNAREMGLSYELVTNLTKDISSNNKYRISPGMRERIKSEIKKGRSKIEILRGLENENK